MSTSARLAHLLLESGAILLRPEKPFTFASGILSPIYCDNRTLLSSPASRKIVVDAYLERIQDFKPDQIVGIATAGIAWGGWIAERLGLQFGYVRSAIKDHGRQNRIEGNLHKSLNRTVLIEDLVSTGGSVISAANALKEAGIHITGIIAIFSYGFEEAANGFTSNGYPFASIVTLDSLLQKALELKKITQSQAEEIRKWKKAPRDWKNR